jgi:cytidine deaminase
MRRCLVSGSGIESIDRAGAAARLPEFPALLEMALLSQTRARAPYSKFRVGAAVLAGSGRFYPGANVESASYGATICAERSAIVGAIAAGETDIRACVIVTATGEPSSPCGICRQLLAEFGPGVAIFSATTVGERVMAARLGDLLPLAFWAGDLDSAAPSAPAEGER